MSKGSSVVAWAAWIVFSEALILVLSFMAYGRSARQRRTGGEGNTIARLFLDDPGFWESMLFYLVLFNVVIGGLLLLARGSAARKRRANGRESAS